MGLTDKLAQVDREISAGHKSVADKLNYWFGWSNFQIARGLNKGRFLPLTAASVYTAYYYGSQDHIAKAVYPFALMISLGAWHAYSDSRRIKKEEKKSEHNKSSTDVLPLELAVDFAAKPYISALRPLTFGAIMSAWTGFALSDPFQGDLGLAATVSALALNFTITYSIMYFAENHNEPKKGKLVETLESMVNKAKSAVRRPVTVLNPGMSYYLPKG